MFPSRADPAQAKLGGDQLLAGAAIEQTCYLLRRESAHGSTQQTGRDDCQMSVPTGDIARNGSAADLVNFAQTDLKFAEQNPPAKLLVCEAWLHIGSNRVGHQ